MSSLVFPLNIGPRMSCISPSLQAESELAPVTLETDVALPDTDILYRLNVSQTVPEYNTMCEGLLPCQPHQCCRRFCVCKRRSVPLRSCNKDVISGLVFEQAIMARQSCSCYMLSSNSACSGRNARGRPSVLCGMLQAQSSRWGNKDYTCAFRSLRSPCRLAVHSSASSTWLHTCDGGGDRCLL